MSCEESTDVCTVNARSCLDELGSYQYVPNVMVVNMCQMYVPNVSNGMIICKMIALKPKCEL